MKKLGVIGGLGPMATVYFLQLVTQMTSAKTDQEHIEILVHSKPSIPDRTRYITGLSDENPLPQMAAVGRGLVSQGAEILAIPCITAHFFQEGLKKETGVPIIDAIEETALYLRENQVSRVGIMATDGTVQGGLFQNTLEEFGIQCVLPDGEGQRKVMHLIYDNIKAGKEAEMELFKQVSRQLFEAGAGTVLLGCTELSLLKRDHELGAGFLDVMEVLARKAVLVCGSLKDNYHHLITE